MSNKYGIVMLVMMLGIALFFSVQCAIGRPRMKIRSDRIMFLKRWYPIALAIYAVLAIIHNLNQLLLGLHDVYVVGLAIHCAILASLLARRGFLFSVVNLWFVLTLLSAVARSAKYFQGNGSATALREGLFSLLLAVLAYVGQRVYVSYDKTPPMTKGDT